MIAALDRNKPANRASGADPRPAAADGAADSKRTRSAPKTASPNHRNDESGAVLLRSVGDLVLKMAGLMIAAELVQRRLVQLKQDFAQLFAVRITGSEALSVNLAQRADQGVSMLVADFAILVAVAIVETCLAQLLSIVPAVDSILPPGSNGN